VGRPRGRDGEEGHRGTLVVYGKSVHIMPRNRKEEISLGATGAARRDGTGREGGGEGG